MKARVTVIMGSTSDLKVMQGACELLDSMEVPYEVLALSAHRTPDRVAEFAATAAERGIEVIIAGAGGAAHLPGVIAASTPLPVIGVPIRSSNSIEGLDSILSILQMPSGIPVATVAWTARVMRLSSLARLWPMAMQPCAKRLSNLRPNLLRKSTKRTTI